MINPEDVKKEAARIIEILQTAMGKHLDGRTCITKLREQGSINWKQMEWLGWYVEEVGRKALITQIDGKQGPRYGMTEYDYQKNYVWDFKVHSMNNANGKENPWVLLNDAESISNVIRDFGGVGFIICLGKVQYDLDGAFKEWHDNMKGGISDYEKERIKRGARSRLRKKTCDVQSWRALFFANFRDLENGINEDWVKPYQKNWRNADGSPRRVKFMVNLVTIPDEYCLWDASEA